MLRVFRQSLINARFVKPLDAEMMIDLGQRFQRIITIEDNCVQGGFGSAVLEVLADNNINTDIITSWEYRTNLLNRAGWILLFDYLNLNPESMIETIINYWPELLKNSTWELRKIGEN